MKLTTLYKLWVLKKRMNKMFAKIKNLLKSRTTQNVAAGTGVTIGVLAAVRSIWPDLLPWSGEQDGVVDSFIMLVLIPTISRILAFLRTPEKLDGVKTLTPLIVLLCVGLLIGGCTTTGTLPGGGDFETKLDAQAAVIAAQAIVALGDQGAALAERIYALQEARDEAKYEREKQEQQERLDRLLLFVQQMLAVVQPEPRLL